MPKITLENGTEVEISPESYDALRKAVQKTWVHAVMEYERALMNSVFEADYRVRTLKVRRCMQTCSRDFKIFISRLIKHDYIMYNFDSRVFRETGGRISYEDMKEYLGGWG